MPGPESSPRPELVIRPVGSADSAGLAVLFAALVVAGDQRHFHPHPLTPEEAERISRYQGLDEYHVALAGRQIVGYGLLRGWGEGYAIPSLGVSVHPGHRHRGVGRSLVMALHAVAASRGAERVRLRVHPDNTDAIELYRSVGYEFGSEPSQVDDSQLSGFVVLPPAGFG